MTITNINVGLYKDTNMQRNQITLESCEIKGLQITLRTTVEITR